MSITPGPWEVSKNGVLVFSTKLAADNVRDASVAILCIQDEKGRQAANAAAIAAVPDLLDACEAAVDAWHADNRNFERELAKGAPAWLTACRSAIAKVKIK